MLRCYSRGNINAPIMLVGENPGKDEAGHMEADDNGDEIKMPIPFCGKSGRVLHRMLRWADINEGDFILTNASKRLFMDGKRARTPHESELLEERGNLITEIIKIDPKIIITLGTGPIWILCYHTKIGKEEVRITKLNGVWHDLDVPENGKKYRVLPLLHPAAICRDEDGSKKYKEAVTKVMLKEKDTISQALGRIML